MKKIVFAGIAAVGMGLSVLSPLAALAAPSNFPENENACVGNSSTTANALFQSTDPDKFRADQATNQPGWEGQAGQPGRADNVALIPQCLDNEPGRGHLQ